MVFVQIDLLRMMNPKFKPNDDHLSFLIQTHWNHSGIEIDINKLKCYVDKIFEFYNFQVYLFYVF